MEDLNFTLPPVKPTYNSKVALKYFRASGNTMNVAIGKTIFVENRKSNPLFLQHDKMYFLQEGEVDLTVKKNHVCSIQSGELFGEMGLITGMPRTATAKAKTDCHLYTLTNDQLHLALSSAPEFALLLMSIMITRLRDTIAFLKMHSMLANNDELKDVEIFDKKLLDKLTNELEDSAHFRYAESKTIVQEGQSGIFMYVVLKGSVEVAVQNNVVGRIERGGIFGEMALITREERLASAVATTNCEVLAISRDVFLDLVCDNPKFAVSLLCAVGNRARYMAAQRV